MYIMQTLITLTENDMYICLKKLKIRINRMSIICSGKVHSLKTYDDTY